MHLSMVCPRNEWGGGATLGSLSSFILGSQAVFFSGGLAGEFSGEGD